MCEPTHAESLSFGMSESLRDNTRAYIQTRDMLAKLDVYATIIKESSKDSLGTSTVEPSGRVSEAGNIRGTLTIVYGIENKQSPRPPSS